MSVRACNDISFRQRLAAWSVHLFTASGGVLSLFAIYFIHLHDFIAAFWCMGIAIVIDAVDGALAREVKVTQVTPNFDGGLLDNLIDFVNYVTAPAFFLLVSDLLPVGCKAVGASVVLLVSAFQFSQSDAKTEDHFFKGFPSYWNIVVFYLFFWQVNAWINFAIIISLSVLSFVPIKYVYPSRLDYLTCSTPLRRAMLFATIAWGMATLGLLWLYPSTDRILVLFSSAYIFIYVCVSIYRTFVPLEVEDAQELI